MPAAEAAEPKVTPRRLIAYFALVFGMFMAILDIQIVSSSLGGDPGGPRRGARGDLLGADELPDRRGHHDPALGLSRPGAVDAGPVLDLGRRLHRGERAVRDRDLDRPDDRLPRRPGLHRRRHDPDRLRRLLPDLPEARAGPGDGARRADRDARADHRPDRRRLPDRALLVALAVPRQRHPRDRRDAARLVPRRLRQARLGAAAPLRLRRPRDDGGLSRQPRVRARGGAEERLVPGPRHLPARRARRDGRRRLLLADADGEDADRRPLGLRQPQLRGRLPADLRARHRPLRAHLPLSALPRAGARLLGARDRRDRLRHRRLHVPDRAGRRHAGAQDRPAAADLLRPRALRLLDLRPDADHRRLGLRRALPAAGAARGGADVVHDPDQHDRPRHAAAAAHPERLGPVQPDAQPRRRLRPRRHQHRPAEPRGAARVPPRPTTSPGARAVAEERSPA